MNQHPALNISAVLLSHAHMDHRGNIRQEFSLAAFNLGLGSLIFMAMTVVVMHLFGEPKNCD
jgi:hypothetical protein